MTLAAAPRLFDGFGRGDPVRVLSASILERAVADERGHRGRAELTETLACFIEFRIAEALRDLCRD